MDDEKLLRERELVDAVGKVAVSAGRFEVAFHNFTATLLGGKAVHAYVALAGLNHSEHIKIASTLARFVTGGDLQERLLKLVKNVDDVRERRNTALHSAWFVSDQPGQVQRIAVKQRLNKGLVVIDTTEGLEFFSTLNQDYHLLFEEVTELSRELSKAHDLPYMWNSFPGPFDTI